MSKSPQSEELIRRRNAEACLRHLHLLAKHHMDQIGDGDLKTALKKILDAKKAGKKPKRPVKRKLPASGVSGPPNRSLQLVLTDILADGVPIPLHLLPSAIARLVLKAVAKKHNTTVTDIKYGRRFKNTARAKFEAYYILRTKAHWSFPKIAKHLKVDHSTVIHGCRRHLEIRKQEAA